MRRSMLVWIVLGACGGSAPPLARAPGRAQDVSVTSDTPTAPDLVSPKAPPAKPDTVASADPCEGGQVTSERGGDGPTGIGLSGGEGGGGGPGSKPTPSEPGGVVVSGSLDRDVIRRVVQAHAAEVRACYERALAKNPELRGRSVVKFTIDGTGKVSTATATGFDRGVDDCLARRVKTWEFPRPNGGAAVAVTYPFTFASG